MYLRDSKFLISCAARTGSTFLLHLLRSHPQILAHGEVVNVQKVGAILGCYAERRKELDGYERALHLEMMRYPERFLQSCVFDCQGHAVVGFKYKTDEAFDPQYRAFSSVLVADTDIKVIHLRRRDLLAQYVSHQVVLNQTSLTLLHRGQERPEIEPFAVDPKHALDYFADVTAREQRAIASYQGHRTLSVEYETLRDENSPQRQEVLEFLGVPARPLTSTTRKIIKDSRTLITNLDETLGALHEAGYSERLKPLESGAGQPNDA